MRGLCVGKGWVRERGRCGIEGARERAETDCLVREALRCLRVAEWWLVLAAQELGQISKGAPEGIKAGPINGDNMLAWEASIAGDVSRQPLASGMLRLCSAPSACPAAAAAAAAAACL